MNSKIKLLLALLLTSALTSCMSDVTNVATAAKVNEQATLRNQQDYVNVVNVLTDNLTSMHDKQLELLAAREIVKIEKGEDPDLRTQQLETLLSNQTKARAAFKERVDAFKARAFGARNFHLALQMSAALSRFTGSLSDSAADVSALLDQLGIAIEQAPAIDVGPIQ